jgi:hypothetical protein
MFLFMEKPESRSYHLTGAAVTPRGDRAVDEGIELRRKGDIAGLADDHG